MKTAKQGPKTIDEYIATFPEPIQAILEEIRVTIAAVVPHASETISYGIPTFKVNNKAIVHFAAFENHIGFYPAPVGIEAFKEKLARFKTGKGSVQFPVNEPMPLELISEITRFRIAANVE